MKTIITCYTRYNILVTFSFYYCCIWEGHQCTGSFQEAGNSFEKNEYAKRFFLLPTLKKRKSLSVVFKHFQNLNISFWKFWRKNCISLDLRPLYSLKRCKAFRIALCKKPQFVKQCSGSDLYFIFGTCGTAQKEILFNFQYKCAEVPISPISKSTLPFSAASSFLNNMSTLMSGSTKW